VGAAPVAVRDDSTEAKASLASVERRTSTEPRRQFAKKRGWKFQLVALAVIVAVVAVSVLSLNGGG